MAFCVQARRGESWPDESDSGTFRNSRCPGAFGQLSTLARLQVPQGRRSSLGGAAGAPGGRSKTRVWESQARGRLSTGSPTLTSGPPFSRSSSSSGSSASCPLSAPSPPLPLPLFRTTSPLRSSFVSYPPLSLHPLLHPSFPQAGA